jgi:hypothetical protein
LVEQFSIDDYVVFHADAIPTQGPRASGGVSTYFKMETFVTGKLVKLTCPVWWALAVRWVRGDSPGLVIVNTYAAMHTTGVSYVDFEVFFNYVNDLRSTYGMDEFVILGDMNVDRFCRANPSKREERQVLTGIAELERVGFRTIPDCPLVTFPDASTTLDYVCFSSGLHLGADGWRVEEWLNCQHLPVVASLHWPGTSTLAASTLCRREPNLRFSRESFDALRELLAVCLKGVGVFPDPGHAYSTIVEAFLMYGHARDNLPSQNGLSWWRYVPTHLQSRLAELEADGQFLARDWIEGTSNFTTDEVIGFRRELNEVSALCRDFAEKAIMEEMQGQFPSHALCWKVLRRIRGSTPTVAIDIGTLSDHFQRIFHRRDRPLMIAPDQQHGWGSTAPGERHLDSPFSDRELKRALKDLNGQAGTGPERIPSQVIKDVFADDSARSSLLILMNACFQTGTIPEEWGMAELFILHKGKGPLNVSDNYRAIALSNDFRRVYQRLIQARLSSWSTAHNATGDMQFGFKSGTGMIEAIFVLRTFVLYVTRILCVPVFAIFIDLRKAFPSLSRAKTIETLRKKRVPWKVT